MYDEKDRDMNNNSWDWQDAEVSAQTSGADQKDPEKADNTAAEFQTGADEKMSGELSAAEEETASADRSAFENGGSRTEASAASQDTAKDVASQTAQGYERESTPQDSSGYSRGNTWQDSRDYSGRNMGQMPQGYQGNGYSYGGSMYQGQYYGGQPYQGSDPYYGRPSYPNQNMGHQSYQGPSSDYSGNGYQGNQGNGNVGPNRQNWQHPEHMQEKKPEGKSKKKGGIVKKTAGIAAAALMFGIIAGGTMVGVNMLADTFLTDDAPTVTVAQPTERLTLSDEELDRLASHLNLSSDGVSVADMDVSDIVKKAMPSVVAINNTMLYQASIPWFGGTQTYEVPSAGSGIIVGQNDTELLIATNNHVVEGATELSVVFIDDTELEATIKGTDSESDLAIVAVKLESIPTDTLSQITIAELGDSDALEIGQGVIAIGNALGYGQAVTVGYVSALNRQVTSDGITRSLLQTDAAINPGNSGGALLNMQGQVIGINEAKYSDTDVEGMGFAIPISQAQDILDSLMVRRSGEPVAPEDAGYLGIRGKTVDSTMIQEYDMPAGVYVYQIVEGGAASKTDLREKDIIVQMDGQVIKTYAGLQDLLQYYKKGETVDLVVKSLEYGEYVERTVTITLGGADTLG